MTIREKKDALHSYCRGQDSCSNCVLNNKKYNWFKIGTSEFGEDCLDIEESPESDLDKALALISYKDKPTDTPTDHIRPLSPEQSKVCADVIKFYGYDTERMVAIEEMSELTKELSKQKRGKGDRAHIIEEIADVYICLEMLEQMNGITREELYEWIDKKVDRIDKRIKSEGKIEAESNNDK